MKKILSVFGTRPEAIKMAPVIEELGRFPSEFESRICVTAQHREMLDGVLELFEISPDYDLNIMAPKQSLTDVTCAVLRGFEPILEEYCPDLVLVHGDTTTALSASLASFYRRVDVGHVEAGLRTGNLYSPWPEELNRRFVDVVARYHYAPTQGAKENLVREGVQESSIVVTGNTGIDALLATVGRLRINAQLQGQLAVQFSFLDSSKRLILVTGHRRENFGAGLELISSALKAVAETRSDVEFVYPVHMNPNVQEPVKRILQNVRGVHLIEPQEYLQFVYLMDRCHFIITDSGGVQEEASSLGKPILLLRDTTERPEAVSAGAVRLVGQDAGLITQETIRLLDSNASYESMSKVRNIFGDGRAAARVVSSIL